MHQGSRQFKTCADVTYGTSHIAVSSSLATPPGRSTPMGNSTLRSLLHTSLDLAPAQLLGGAVAHPLGACAHGAARAGAALAAGCYAASAAAAGSWSPGGGPARGRPRAVAPRLRHVAVQRSGAPGGRGVQVGPERVGCPAPVNLCVSFLQPTGRLGIRFGGWLVAVQAVSIGDCASIPIGVLVVCIREPVCPVATANQQDLSPQARHSSSHTATHHIPPPALQVLRPGRGPGLERAAGGQRVGAAAAAAG